MGGFVSKIFKKPKPPAPPPAPKPKPKPQATTKEGQGGTPSKGLSQGSRGGGGQRTQTKFTGPLGLSVAQRSGGILKKLLGQ